MSLETITPRGQFTGSGDGDDYSRVGASEAELYANQVYEPAATGVEPAQARTPEEYYRGRGYAMRDIGAKVLGAIPAGAFAAELATAHRMPKHMGKPPRLGHMTLRNM